MPVVLLYATVVLLLAIVVLLFVGILLFYEQQKKILKNLLRILSFYEVEPLNSEDEPMMNLTLLKPKPRGHKTRKPTDRAKEWMDNRAKDSREVK